MLLHKCVIKNSLVYTLFDRQERVVQYPTFYLGHLRARGRPKASQHHIANTVKLFCRWIEERSPYVGGRVDDAIREIESDDILDWIDDMRGEAKSVSTIHNREVLIREMFGWLTTANAGRLRDDIPWASGTYTKSPHRRLPRFVTAEQVITLLKGLHNESQRAAAHFMFDTGARVSELARLTNRSLPDERDWPEDSNYYPLIVPGSKPYDGGEYKYRYTIISRPVLARIRRYHATPDYALAEDWELDSPDKPVFLNVRGGKLTEDSVRKGLKAAWVRRRRDPREMSPHRLRHGTAFSVLQSEFGKELLDNLLILKSMLGHEKLRTTEIYTAIPVAVLRSVAEKRQLQLKFQEAQRIYDATYLPGRMNTERRGRRG